MPSLRTWARLMARLFLWLSLVLGLSLGFAWAWDRSDPSAAQTVTAAS